MSEQENIQKVIAKKSQDVDLVYFARLVNISKIGLNVVLVVKGSFISGKLISGSEYYERLKGNFAHYDKGTQGSAIFDYFEGNEQVYTDNNQDDFEPPSNFIHLDDVYVMGGAAKFAPFTGACLRIKIEEIDGYFFGALEQDN
ncbi:hypothetical protein ACM92Y_001057 [Cronobacter malonaticus]